MRLTDVDELGVGWCSKDVLPAAYCAGWNGLLGLIEKAPTVDAVVVTRCKDCKHFNHKRMECENEAISTDHEGGAQYSLNFGPDDFCSYGEPKEGDHA
nr:MAG TPA: hypothetical protein [Caudoviricetes sp.]